MKVFKENVMIYGGLLYFSLYMIIYPNPSPDILGYLEY